MAKSVSIYLAWQIWLHCAPQPGSWLREEGLWHPLPSGALGVPCTPTWGALCGKIGIRFFVVPSQSCPPHTVCWSNDNGGGRSGYWHLGRALPPSRCEGPLPLAPGRAPK